MFTAGIGFIHEEHLYKKKVNEDMIICKGTSELDKMRKANLIVAEVLSHLETLIQPGLTTAELDVVAEGMILNMGGQPAFKGYQGYPATLCVSVNEEIVHVHR